MTSIYYLLQQLEPSRLFAGVCESFDQGQGCGLPTVDASSNQVHDVLQIVFGILAALSVLFIVIGGMRMVLSQGNPQETGKGRSTIIYALIGLVIALLAEAIVSLVLGKLK